MNDIQINMTANKKLQKELTDEEKKKMEEKNKGIKAKRKGLIESIFDKKNEIKYEDYVSVEIILGGNSNNWGQCECDQKFLDVGKYVFRQRRICNSIFTL